ncbi:MAG: hypothetical protein Q8L48_14970 [Archangium sp.]|nr:hypothetical protein [Archangium sp.]
MKIDVLKLLMGKKPEARKGAPAPGFEAALLAESPHPKAGRGAAPASSSDEKKPRAASSTEEALLVSRNLTPHARPHTLFVTKQPDLKDPRAPKALAAASPQKAVTLDQLATRSREQHAPARVTGPTEKKPLRGEQPQPREATRERTHEAKRSDEAPVTAQTSVAAQVQTSEPFRLEAPAPIKEAAPLVPLAPVMNDDPSLRVVLLPTIARLSMDTGEAGRINVQLKVQDGVTELRATGPAAQLLESRQGELRVALAKEGLALGHFDLTQSGSQHRHAERPELEFSPPPTARRAVSSQDPAAEDGRVHVKA